MPGHGRAVHDHGRVASDDDGGAMPLLRAGDLVADARQALAEGVGGLCGPDDDAAMVCRVAHHDEWPHADPLSLFAEDSGSGRAPSRSAKVTMCCGRRTARAMCRAFCLGRRPCGLARQPMRGVRKRMRVARAVPPTCAPHRVSRAPPNPAGAPQVLACARHPKARPLQLPSLAHEAFPAARDPKWATHRPNPAACRSASAVHRCKRFARNTHRLARQAHRFASEPQTSVEIASSRR
ncbi:hypothetical protein EV672_101760 [Aquabacterium commune]|uniref:Uncharacterized protein n=1 Tax=Aquabacterium commune TaxID=70586 RepID=A0A4R6RQX8_9BURK|nr:hypothetical protein EV672_101760 [Aquabacterium commune]